MTERKNLHAFKGNPLTLVGEGVAAVGQKAPDFAVNKSLGEQVKLSDFAGKVVVLNVVPSLDTPVCSNQTARFNKEAGALGDGVVILTISMDLPPAQARWCQANAATNIVTASDFKDRDFAHKYSLYIKELGLLARSVFVIGKDGVVKYEQIVPELSAEPDYAPVLSAVKNA